MEDIFRYWHSCSRTLLQPYLPADVYAQISPKGEYFEGLHRVFKVLFQKADQKPQAFLEWDKQRISREISAIKGIPEKRQGKGRSGLTLLPAPLQEVQPAARGAAQRPGEDVSL